MLRRAMMVFLLMTLIWAVPGSALDLAQLAELASQRNLSLQIARLQLEESWIDERKADNGFIPDANLEFSNYQKSVLDSQQKSLPFAFNKTVLYSLTIKQNFPALGKFHQWQRDVARLRSRLQERQIERQGKEILRRVVSTFFQMVKFQEIGRIHEFNLVLLAQLLEIGRINQQVGLALERDVLRIEVQQANTQAALVRARHDFHNQRLELANLLNLPDLASPGVELPPSLRFPTVEIAGSEARTLLLERDPDLALARTDREIFHTTLRAARQGHLPSLDLKGTYTHGAQYGSLRNTRDYSMSVTLNVPVFDSGDLRNEVRRAEKVLARADLGLQDLEAGKILTLEKALADHDEARQRIVFAEKALEQSRENMRVVGIRYKAGDAPIADLVDAQITFSAAAETAINAYYDERVRLGEIFLLTDQRDRTLTLDRGAAPPIAQAIDLSGEASAVSPDIPAMDEVPSTPTADALGKLDPGDADLIASLSAPLPPSPPDFQTVPEPVAAPATYITPDLSKDGHP